MKPEIKQLWLEALRSGKYIQTTKALHKKTGGFCCLGVLIDICPFAKWVPSEIPGLELKAEAGSETNTGFLPVSVQKWAGLDEQDPIVGSEGGESLTLAYLNDNGHSFNEIANLIEEKL